VLPNSIAIDLRTRHDPTHDQEMPNTLIADEKLKERALDAQSIISMGQAVIDIEANAIIALKSRIDDNFVAAARLLLQCRGRIIVSGVGKSGHIGSKIAATLSSTGSPAFFVHPAEASHGDLGMMRAEDVFLAISYSGQSDELKTILPVLKRQDIDLISLTGKEDSPLAQAATIHLNIEVEKEACPLGLAPTASTSATLAMGDALAIALLSARGFTANDFALSHPGGTLGRKLLLKVNDVMAAGKSMPLVSPDTILAEALIEVSEKKLGLAVVTDNNGRLLGIFTDGDLRRALDHVSDVRSARIGDVMTRGGLTIEPDALAASAVSLMQEHKISVLPVVDQRNKICGVLHMHMLLSAGVV